MFCSVSLSRNWEKIWGHFTFLDLLLFWCDGLCLLPSAGLWLAGGSSLPGRIGARCLSTRALGRCWVWSQPTEEAVAVPKSPGEFQPKSTRLLGSHQPWFPGPFWDLHLLATSLHPDSTWEGLNSVGFLMVFETEKSGMDWVFSGCWNAIWDIWVCRSCSSCSGCFRWRVHDRWWWGMSLKG